MSLQAIGGAPERHHEVAAMEMDQRQLLGARRHVFRPLEIIQRLRIAVLHAQARGDANPCPAAVRLRHGGLTEACV